MQLTRPQLRGVRPKPFPGFLRTTILSLLGLLACPPPLQILAATNTASLHLYSTSLQIDPGQASFAGQVYRLTYSSWANWTHPNGEFYTFFNEVPQTNYSALLLWDVNWDMPVAEGAISVIVPHDLDDPEDGVPDFYQVQEEINRVSPGGTFAVADPENPNRAVDFGTVTARWQRAAGEHRGTCTLTLLSDANGPPMPLFSLPTDFVHPFEIREFVGELQYVPTNGSTLIGMLDVGQIGDPARRFSGPLPLERISDVPGFEFWINPAAWTDAESQPVELLGSFFWDYDLRYELEYYGQLVLRDGDASTPEEDYYEYFVAIDDPNDTDGDGVPDLSDPVSVHPPSVSLLHSPGGQATLLQIRGQPGQTVQVQTADHLMAESWDTPLAASITLTNTQQSVVLPAPTGTVAFYRVALLNP